MYEIMCETMEWRRVHNDDMSDELFSIALLYNA